MISQKKFLVCRRIYVCMQIDSFFESPKNSCLAEVNKNWHIYTPVQCFSDYSICYDKIIYICVIVIVSQIYIKILCQDIIWRIWISWVQKSYMNMQIYSMNVCLYIISLWLQDFWNFWKCNNRVEVYNYGCLHFES